MLTKQQKQPRTLITAVSIVFAALVFVATYMFVISIPATSGYFNLGETIIYIAALTFGPLTGGLAGGVGAMSADAILGYAQFAPGTLIIKGVEGAVVGVLHQWLRKRLNHSLSAAIAIGVGGLEMVLGYFVYEQAVLGYPFAAALAEVPFNLVQMSAGLVIAVPVVAAVRRVFPQIKI